MPSRYKTGLVKTLLYRSFKLCSSYPLFHSELLRLKDILVTNSYRINFVDSIIRSFLNKQFVHIKKVTTVERMPLTITLPYLGRYSLELRRKIRTFLKSAYPQLCLKIAFITVERIGSRFTIKDTLPKELASNVVYRYKCSSCDATYIGKTSRHFGVRTGEHLGISIRTNKSIKPDKNSAIQQHFLDSGHVLHLDNFKIIDRAQTSYTCMIKEALQIVQCKPSLNCQQDYDTLVLMK